MPNELEAPIYRLSDDILTYIFLLNATSAGGLYHKHAQATVASSQVCARWRALALTYPKIWSFVIDYDSPRHSLKWIETLLQRSHPALLDFGSRTKRIHLTDHKDGGMGVIELVLNHINRIRIFNLQVQVSTWELVRSRFLRQQAPNLDFISIHLPSNIGRLFTDPLFNHHAPRLRHLHLHRWTVDLASPVLRSLTEIYVDSITGLGTVPTVLGWLNILGGMPLLRWVTIIHAVSSAAADIVLPMIHLDDLEMLSIDGEFHEAVALIDHLVAPARCSLRLRGHHAQLGHNQRTLWGIIEKKLESWEKDSPNRRPEASMQGDRVTVGHIEWIQSVLWDAEAESVQYKWYPQRDPILVVMLPSPSFQDMTPLFLSLFALFGQTFRTTAFLRLWVEYGASDGEEVFRPLVDILQGFANLDTLDLSLDFGLSFIFPLLRHVPSDGSVLLPALHTLNFIKADFTPRSESLAQVAAFLRWRKEQGVPISKISISHSWIDRKFIRAQIQGTEVEIDP